MKKKRFFEEVISERLFVENLSEPSFLQVLEAFMCSTCLFVCVLFYSYILILSFFVIMT